MEKRVSGESPVPAAGGSSKEHRTRRKGKKNESDDGGRGDPANNLIDHRKGVSTGGVTTVKFRSNTNFANDPDLAGDLSVTTSSTLVNRALLATADGVMTVPSTTPSKESSSPSSSPSVGQDTLKKRNKWRKSSSWSPNALHEEIKKMSAQEGSPAPSPLATAGSKGSRGKKAKDQIGSHSSGTASVIIPSVTGEPEHTSSIVLELRKMKELKKQEEEAANKDKKGKKHSRVEKKKIKKKKANDSIVFPTLVDKALTYIEQNHKDVDQTCLSDELTTIQKKVFKILKDALDSDLKQAHKLNSAGSSLAGSFADNLLSPRGEQRGYSTISAGTRLATAASINTLSALKKDEAGEWIVDFNSYDMPCAIAFLKYFLTEQQLIPDQLYQGLCAAIEIQFQNFRLNEMHSLLSRLPQINLLVLKRLLLLLSTISKNTNHKLTIGRVATSFATVTLAPSHAEAQDIRVQRKDISVLRELIMNYDGLFTANMHLQFIERDGNLLVRCATLPKIVEKLVDESYSEFEFADIIFLTHSYFTSAPDLLTALINIHNDNNRMPTIANKNWQHRIRLRVLRLIHDWVSGYPDDILNNRIFLDILKEFVHEKPAGLLGKRSLIPEEETVFQSLETWLNDALKKHEELAKLKEPELGQEQEQAGANDTKAHVSEVSPQVEEIDRKVSNEDPEEIPEEIDTDDDLSVSDVELKFSSDDEDDEEDDSADETNVGSAHTTPSIRKLSFTPLAKGEPKANSAENKDGNMLQRKPPMLGQMKRGPQMMSSSDFFNILAKGTQVMLKEQSLSANALSLDKKPKPIRTTRATTDSVVSATKDHADDGGAGQEKPDVQAEAEANIVKIEEPKAVEQLKDEQKESDTKTVPEKKAKSEKKSKKKSSKSGSASSEKTSTISDGDEAPKKVEKEKRKRKLRASKSTITRPCVSTLPDALPSRGAQSESDVLLNVKSLLTKPNPTDSPSAIDPPSDDKVNKKSLSGERKVKKKKKGKRKYQTLKKLTTKKKDTGGEDKATTRTKQKAIEDILSTVAFSPGDEQADRATTTQTLKTAETSSSTNSAESQELSAPAPSVSSKEIPSSPDRIDSGVSPTIITVTSEASVEATPVSLDTIDRNEIVERIKDRTDIESRLLVHLIDKEKQLEREIDSLRKAVERLLLEKVERSVAELSGPVATSSSNGGSGKKTHTLRAEKDKDSKSSKETESVNTTSMVAIPPKDVGGGSGFQIFFMDHVALAKELTLRDSKIFHAVETTELLHKRFMTPEKSPTFQKMVQSFNQIADWVLSEVLRYETPADRGNAITAFIRICDQLWLLKNFNMLFAILGGLDRTPVRRLKLSWKKVPTKEKKIFKKQMTLTDTEKNNAIYRHALRRAKPPLVPYLALFSKDLFSLDEGVPTLITNQEGGDSGVPLINFDKLRLLYQLVKEFRQLQQTVYTDLESSINTSTLQALLDMSPPLDEKASYNLSYQWEPRVTKS